MVNKLKFHRLSIRINVRCHGNNKILLIQNEAILILDVPLSNWF